MRTWIFALLFLTAIGTTSRADELLDQLNADPTKKKSVKAGMRLLDDFFKAEAAMRKPKVRDPAKLAGKMTQAKNSFTKWMEGTQKSLGVDLGTKPQTIIDMLDQAGLIRG